MATKKRPSKSNGDVKNLLNLAVWITGILVSLAVGFGMIDNVLSVRFIPDAITAIAGWVVVTLTLLGVLLAIVNSFVK